MSKKNRYGWRPSYPDHRDLVYQLPHGLNLPSSVDLRSYCPDVYDQGNLGSCTANAISGAIQTTENIIGKTPQFSPSRLFIYYNERSIEGTVNSDSGAMIRDGMKSIAKQGVCDEALWPYIVNKFKAKPNLKCYQDALSKMIHKYENVPQTQTGIMSALAQNKPVIFGTAIYESFETSLVANTGMVPYPSKSERLLGGHALCIVGYLSDKQLFIVRNSWGSSWGDKGYCYFPFNYILNPKLTSDIWCIDLL